MQRMPDVSVVITAHREGLIAGPTLKSLRRARLHAQEQGYTVETIVCLDRCDDLTRQVIIAGADEDARILEVDFGDPGLSRNHAVSHSHGRYISFLDADDLFGRTWLARAVKAADREPREVIWHPEVNLYFGLDPHIFRHVDMDDAAFDPLSMIAGNPWTGLCFAERGVFERFPYPKTDLARGVGYEDWGWNRRVITEGFVHKIVKGTGHAIRQKAVSVVKQTTAAGVLPAGTDLFRKILEERANVRQYRSAIEPQASQSPSAFSFERSKV